MPRYLLALLLLLTACADPVAQENAYHQAYELALGRPVYPLVGPGLRLGMKPAQVRRHLDSLRGRDELDWHLSDGQVPTTYAPTYANGGLTQLVLLLKADGNTGSLTYLELQRGLRLAYGGDGYPHEVSSEQPQLSWFKGGTEIALTVVPGTGYLITYTDLPSSYLSF